MSSAEHRIISIGALDRHPLWEGDAGGRTGHATTTLIRVGGGARGGAVNMIVDPGLPGAALAARLMERSGLRPVDVTHVVLTSFHPDARRGVSLFENAVRWVSEAEREAVGVVMLQNLERLVEAGEGESEPARAIREDVELLRTFEAAPDRLADGVDLFPMPGVTPGMCGVLVAHARYTLLVAGDAAATREHIEAGRVLQRAADLDAARESLTEALEIADLIVPGRDDLVVNPLRSPF